MGHSEAAPGVVSLIKATSMLQCIMILPQPDQPLTLNPTLCPFLALIFSSQTAKRGIATEMLLAIFSSTILMLLEEKIDRVVSRAVLVQGTSRSCEAPLFMTTDGSRTVESYIHLGALPNGRRIYALESPFVRVPGTFDLFIQEMASIFIRAIRKMQAHGPYLIEGWSAGSVYAHEGEGIAAFIMLDMRAPSLIPTSIVTTDFVERLGTFEGINRARHLPEELSVREGTHLMATCRALSQYDAPAFPVHRRPRHVAIVWARLGLDNRQDAPLAVMGRPGLDIGKTLAEMTLSEFEHLNSWIYRRRQQLGMNGWETLLGDHIAIIFLYVRRFPPS
ncbi:hypothetical protein E4U55_000996 [Claviceps digitariae]|nr:hypothetical protein E4U55_000996 [Claviceps digitariae]